MRSLGQELRFRTLLGVLVSIAGACGSGPGPSTGKGGAPGLGGNVSSGGAPIVSTGGASSAGGASSGGRIGSGGTVLFRDGGVSSEVGGSADGPAMSRDVAVSSGGSPGSGGQTSNDASATGGASTGGAGGGSGGTIAACASDESSKCTSGTGPLGTEIKCDFGGGDGNYDVTVEVGGAEAGDTFVDAEMFRRMLPELATLAGQPRRFAFAVNVRTPEGEPVQVGSTDSVPGLQVYFRGPKPKVNAICHQTASKPFVLWLGGDSTVCDQDSANYTGWGQHFPQFLQAGVSLANYADSGESSGSFLGSSKMFGAIKSRWKAGDWFFVQLGHNDKTVSADTFQSNMKSFVTQAKAASVNIVLITPIARVGYALAEEHVNSTGANLPQIIRDLGKSENVPVIDLTVTTWNWIQTITPKDYFAADSSASGGYDHTHLGPKGADAVAGFVRDAIKSNPGVPALVPYLR
jgi:lysophospholipase L1-like esterase